jgi:osmotically-inducible protein OsmY
LLILCQLAGSDLESASFLSFNVVQTPEEPHKTVLERIRRWRSVEMGRDPNFIGGMNHFDQRWSNTTTARLFRRYRTRLFKGPSIGTTLAKAMGATTARHRAGSRRGANDVNDGKEIIMNTKKTAVVAFIGTVLFGLMLSAPGLAADRVDDADISYWVKSALRQDERVDASRVTVATSDGIVTLSGDVDDITSKQYAEREAKKINGVLGVVNQINVDAGWRSDTDIELVVRRRILNSAVIASEGITVTSVSGKVTLTGEVDSWSEWEEAGLLAGGVRGVREVVNDLRVVPAAGRSDQEIKNDVVAALTRDVYTTGLPIAVSVKDEMVTLTGSVGNAFEKDRAEDTVRWISDVRGVNNFLEVNWTEKKGVRDTDAAPPDSKLQRSVRAELDQDWRLIDSDISATVSHGHVTLDGSVPNHSEKRLAEKDVRDVVGVGWVTNNLFARVDEREDNLIELDVNFDLTTDSTVGAFDIKPSVVNGVVTLSGDVHTWYQKFHAGELAAGVRGVRQVINDIAVARTNWESDAELTEKIAKRLTWNWTTWLVHDDIGVTVKNGVATLTGDVNKWSQRKEAGDVAIETPGVWKVDNRLTVKGYDYPWDEWYTKPS